MPPYETDADREREQILSDWLERMWNCRIVKIGGRFGKVDRRVFRDKRTVGVLELKWKNALSTQYPCIYFDVAKARNCKAAGEYFHCRGLYVARYDDAVFYLDPYKVESENCPVVITGRTDRDDPNDRRPTYMVPYALAHRIGEDSPTQTLDRAMRDIGRQSFGLTYPEDVEELS